MARIGQSGPTFSNRLHVSLRYPPQTRRYLITPHPIPSSAHPPLAATCVHALPLESRPVIPHTHGRYNGQHSAHKRRSKNERRGARRHLTPPSSQLAIIPAPSSRLPSFRQRPIAATLDLLSKLHPRHSGASTIDSPPPPPRLRLIRAATSRGRRELRALALPDSNDRWGQL